MKVFLGWSGPTSHKIAIVLRDWLPQSSVWQLLVSRAGMGRSNSRRKRLAPWSNQSSSAFLQFGGWMPFLDES
jgi:hypothetical protein